MLSKKKTGIGPEIDKIIDKIRPQLKAVSVVSL